MLYDPTYEINSILTIARFKEWLDKQPAEGRYSYGECWNCALAQYLKSEGFGKVVVNARDVRVNYKWVPLAKELNDIVEQGDHSFGEASKRAAEWLSL